ncbi:glycoside hydrolase [Diplogelasinospora grovesii]|uniref:Alpha-galactosidase n=1 Tax=Diplogelasinospora grovesii TaxID=303347 RepID=A0AAN6NBP8_9PEZI|nr:glycoside hydrolase [Diplogelasinospora grovesii]
MGWDNWNAFGCSVSESLLLSQARLISSLGLRDIGYEYVVLDDCWSSGRDANGSLIADATKFPRGMAAVAQEIHAMGLKFGMYSSAGKYTCGMYEGSLGHEQSDAHTFASWGVDYLKYDNCYNQGQAGNQLLSYTRYKAMSDALLSTGREMLYSLCNWGEDFPWNWGSTISNSWRISGDVYDSFDRPDDRCPCDGPDAFNCELPGFHCSILNIINKASFIVSKAQPGAWNDLDILTVGLGGMTDAEYVTHFSLWAAAKSPLLTGADFTKITPKTLSIFSNAAVVAVNQDPQGSSAARRWHKTLANDTNQWGSPSQQQMWSGSLNSTTGDENDMVVILINGASTAQKMEATLQDIFIDSGTGNTAPQVKMAWEVRDLWAYRMTDNEARYIISNNNTVGYNGTSYYYNATKTSYAEGLQNKEELLLGKMISTVKPSGTVTATVDRHGAAMFRLRAVPTGKAEKREL